MQNEWMQQSTDSSPTQHLAQKKKPVNPEPYKSFMGK